jgi:hypothetical protein
LKTAIFTLVGDDPWRLRYWLRYYSRFFAEKDTFVLCHTVTGVGHCGALRGAQYVNVHWDTAYDHEWMLSAASRFHSFLMGSYERVIFVEVDEFLVPDPEKYKDLAAYLAEVKEARASGVEILHTRNEPNLDWDVNWFAQRSTWTKSTAYSKFLVCARTPRWGLGFHAVHDLPNFDPDPNLLLVHAHRIDYYEASERHKRAVNAPWKKSEIEAGRGRQSRIVDLEQCRAFCAGEYSPVERAQPEKIPERFKTAILP